VLVKPTTCKSGAPTLDGSNCSNMKRINSLTGLTTRDLMLLDLKTKKVKLLELPITTTKPTKNGELSILTRQRRLKLKVLMKNSVSTLTDHSTLDPDFLCRDLLNATVPTTSG
jgi:hypothetical protein